MTSARGQTLKNPFPEDTIKVDSSKLKGLQKAYDDLKQILFQQDDQQLLFLSYQLKDFSKQILSVTQKITNQKVACLKQIKALDDQVKDLNKKISTYQSHMQDDNSESVNKKEKLQNQYLEKSKKRIGFAKQLETKKIAKLYLKDRKSIAHEPFKWVIVVIYGEPESKYYWPNFNEQAFQNDKGEDFKERLGKVTALKASEEQKLKTQWFIQNFGKISEAPELKVVNAEIKLIRNIAIEYLECYELGKRIQSIQALMTKRKEESIEKDVEFTKWRGKCEALNDRITLKKEYLAILSNYQEKLNPKAKIYDQKATTLDTAVEKLAVASVASK